MGTIVAARFQEQDQIDRAIAALADTGIAREKMSNFYVNPPGQHDLYPIGGDRDDSPGAHETGEGVAKGAATGGALGAAAGLTGVAVFGPIGPAVGALVGAHIGGLMGGLSEMKEKGEDEKNTADGPGSQNELTQRKSGMLLAVEFDAQDADALARTLKSFGGVDIETAQGTIVEGDWQDFDPLRTPTFIAMPTTSHTS
ncbi:MAG: hypothetical protein V4695_12635 [Pseudomonadota bacterium]